MKAGRYRPPVSFDHFCHTDSLRLNLLPLQEEPTYTDQVKDGNEATQVERLEL